MVVDGNTASLHASVPNARRDRATFMIQGALLALVEPTALSPRVLVKALLDGRWHHREDLALRLGVSVRAIRDAASHAKGEVLSSQRGLKLTICAMPEEVNEAMGRARSQVREMERRILETERVWHSRTASKECA